MIIIIKSSSDVERSEINQIFFKYFSNIFDYHIYKKINVYIYIYIYHINRLQY